MRKKFSLLFLSIYYPKLKLQQFLKYLLDFFKKENRKYNVKFIFHFSQYRGDNIGLTIRIEESSRAAYVESLWSHVHNFLSQAQPKISDTTKNRSLFMDFPEGSVVFGMHSFMPHLYSQNDRKDLDPFYTSSQLLLARSGTNLKPSGKFLADMLILGIALFQKLKSSFPISSRCMMDIGLASSDLERTLSIYYENNCSILDQIFNTAVKLGSGTGPNSESWKSNWINCFYKNISHYYSNQFTVDISEMFRKAMYYLVIQLGQADTLKLYNYLLNRLLITKFSEEAQILSFK